MYNVNYYYTDIILHTMYISYLYILRGHLSWILLISSCPLR